MEWIKVSERKPEAELGATGQKPVISYDVLVWFEGGDSQYHIANYDHRDGEWYLVAQGFVCPDADPVFWMPLPKAPA